MLNLGPLGPPSGSKSSSKGRTRPCAGSAGSQPTDRMSTDSFREGESLKREPCFIGNSALSTPPVMESRTEQSSAYVCSLFLFVGLLCAAVVAFASEVRPIDSNSTAYGYDEALAAQMSPLLGTEFLSNCSDDDAEITERSENGFEQAGHQRDRRPRRALVSR